MRLPGSSGGKKEIAIQGILKIVFKSIRLSVHHNDDGSRSYLLKLKGIKLKFLVLSIPPSGQTEIVIFGNPKAISASDKTLAWYAAYVKRAS